MPKASVIDAIEEAVPIVLQVPLDQVTALSASRNMGINAQATFSGALAWPYVYPWPQRPAGLIETAFDE